MRTHDRLHSLDSARAFALLLGIVLHATMSFVVGVPAQDSSQSTTLAVTFYVIHIFRMTVFYVIAGFFAHMVFHRLGARAFIADRAKRILVPMTAGWLVLAPVTIAVVIWGLSRTYPDGPPQGADATALAPQGLPLTHLWFLYYLCLFYVLTLTVRAGVVAIDGRGVLRARIDALVGGRIARILAPAGLAVPTAAVLHLDAAWLVWFGISTPDTGLTPQLPALVAYGTAFALGWILHRQPLVLGVLGQHWHHNLAVAGGLTVACLAIVGPTPQLSALTAIDGGAAMRLVYAGCYALAIWYWTFGLIGGAVRFCSGASVVRRYLADASYWLYLAHLPVVFLLQVLLMDVPLHWVVKFPVIVSITLTVLLASYHYLVRPTWVGEILNGRRYPRSLHPPAASTSSPAAPPVQDSRAETAPPPLASLAGVTKRYGSVVALDDVTLAVRPCELLALLGPNGAGKSTTIGLWLGTLQPDGGVASVMGGSPLDGRSRLGVGVMMQDVALAPMLTAREHVALTSSYYREPLGVDETIAIAGIETLADRRYGTLSHGQKRQVQFAIAVCGRPRLLFLDEPTAGLDLEAREGMWRQIRRLLDDGCSIVLTTHYLEEAEALADRVVVLAQGRILADGSVDQMRALVTRTHIRCASTLSVDEVRRWPGVVDAMRQAQVLHVTAANTEDVVRRLLAADAALTHLDVRQASLAEAFTALTKEAA